METGLTMKNKICVVSCLPALDNKFYSRALEIQTYVIGKVFFVLDRSCWACEKYIAHSTATLRFLYQDRNGDEVTK